MILGVSESVRAKIVNLFSNPRISQVKVFGSRAIGTHREGSDIDIVVWGSDIDSDFLRTLRVKFEDLELPYSLDLVHYESIDHDSLRKHIDQNAKDL